MAIWRGLFGSHHFISFDKMNEINFREMAGSRTGSDLTS